MRILYLPGTTDNPYGFTNMPFIPRRIEYLRAGGVNTENFATVGLYDPFLATLVKVKHKEYVRYPKKKWNRTIIFNDIKYNIILYNISTLNFFRYHPLSRLIAKVIDKNTNVLNYDLIHTHFSFPEGHAAKLLFDKYKIPYVVTYHGHDINQLPYKSEVIHKYILKTLDNAFMNIFVSKNLYEKARSIGYTKNNYTIIPNGYNEKIFAYFDKLAIRKELNIYNPNTKYIGFVGHLEYVKRADQLGFIFNRIHAMHPKIRFIVIGKGPEKERIKKECKNLDLIMTGPLNPEKVSKYMQTMDVLILPSRYEGWGCVVKEAQACGTTVVGTNTGGIPEAIGEGGYLVDTGPDFEERFAIQVVKALENPINKNILIKAAEGYSWSNTIKKEIEIYTHICPY
ncbi:MAG TPA: glycosyltransferase [Thermotogota bacterium]|nr:glycosyltransferase [Thermotogota bacterium]